MLWSRKVLANQRHLVTFRRMGRRVIDKRYEVLKRLGSGGMGEIHKVKDRTNGATLPLTDDAAPGV